MTLNELEYVFARYNSFYPVESMLMWCIYLVSFSGVVPLLYRYCQLALLESVQSLSV